MAIQLNKEILLIVLSITLDQQKNIDHFEPWILAEKHPISFGSDARQPQGDAIDLGGTAMGLRRLMGV